MRWFCFLDVSHLLSLTLNSAAFISAGVPWCVRVCVPVWRMYIKLLYRLRCSIHPHGTALHLGEWVWVCGVCVCDSIAFGAKHPQIMHTCKDRLTLRHALAHKHANLQANYFIPRNANAVDLYELQEWVFWTFECS